MTSRNNIALKRQSFETADPLLLSSLPVPFSARACKDKDKETTVRDDLAIQIRAAHETFILDRFPSLLADLQIEILKSNRVECYREQREEGERFCHQTPLLLVSYRREIYIFTKDFPRFPRVARLFQYREYYILVRNNSGEYYLWDK